MESLTRSALYEAASGNRDGVAESSATYFLTLCAVSAPVTLPAPKSASLQRYRFFFSKRQDNGRDSYWLHFGYFRTVEEARKWRDVLCRVYPAAAIRNDARSPAPRQSRQESSLEDTLSELRDSAWRSLDLPEDDTASASGVRHLSVEVEMKGRARQAKTARKL